MDLRHYPSPLTDVVAVGPENRLPALAEHAATTTPISINVVAGMAMGCRSTTPASNASSPANPTRPDRGGGHQYRSIWVRR